MVIVLLYRVTFQASYKGSHFELGITTDMSMRNTIPEPTNQTKVSLAGVLAFSLVTSSPPCYLYVPMHDGTLEKNKDTSWRH